MFTFHLSLPTRHVRVMNWTLILSNLKLFGYRTPFSLDGWNGKVHNRWIIREQSRDSWDLGLFFLNVRFQLLAVFFSLSFFFCLVSVAQRSPLCHYLKFSRRREQWRRAHLVYSSVHVRPLTGMRLVTRQGGKGQRDEFRNDRKQWTFLGAVN